MMAEYFYRGQRASAFIRVLIFQKRTEGHLLYQFYNDMSFLEQNGLLYLLNGFYFRLDQGLL